MSFELNYANLLWPLTFIVHFLSAMELLKLWYIEDIGIVSSRSSMLQGHIESASILEQTKRSCLG